MKIEIKEIRVSIISLPFRTDRRDKIAQIFIKNEMPFSFFDGVYGNTITDYSHLKDQISILSFIHLSNGSIGCILSHTRALEAMLGSNHNYSLIFEDDVILAESFTSAFQKILERVPTNFDIIYLGSGNTNKSNLRAWVSHDLFIPLFPRKGQYAYLISRQGAQKVLRNLFPVKIVLGGIDTIIGRLISKNILTAYHLYPSICFANLDVESNIYNPSLPNKKIYVNKIS